MGKTVQEDTIVYSEDEDVDDESEDEDDEDSLIQQSTDFRDIKQSSRNEKEIEMNTWRVRSRKGAVVRASIDLSSEQVGVIPFGTIVRVTEQRQWQVNTKVDDSIVRCQIVTPLEGWLSKKCVESCAEECRALARLTATALLLQENTSSIRVRRGVVGELECDVVTATHRPNLAIVLAHGVGSADTMVAAARSLIEECGLRQAAIFLPYGQCCGEEGGAWWPPSKDELANLRLRIQRSIEGPELLARMGLTPEIEARPHEGVHKATLSLLSVVDGAARLTDLDCGESVILAGFDQGATCAACVLRQISTHANTFETFAGLALLAPASLFSFCRGQSVGNLRGSQRKIPILVAHGDVDEIVPIVLSRAAAVDLVRAGAKRVRFAMCPGAEHKLSYQMLRVLADFARNAIAQRESNESTSFEAQHGIDDILCQEEAEILRAHKHRNLSFSEFLRQQNRSPKGDVKSTAEQGTKQPRISL